MEEKFQPGDIVKLKSGGPRMTLGHIGTYSGEEQAKCQWFDDHNKAQEGLFYLTALEKAEDDLVSKYAT